MAHARYGDKVRKAVITVAGMGSRFLLATKASRKEMMAVVDKPLIKYAVEKAIDAGITEMIFITGRTKRSIADHFNKAYQLEHQLELQDKTDLLAIAQNNVPKGVSCAYICQTEPLGLGHAAVTATHLIGDEPFAVILADDLISSKNGASSQMVGTYEQYNSAVIAVQKVEGTSFSAYDVISGAKQRDHIDQLNSIVEKPVYADSHSDLGVTGRYIVTPKFFGRLAALKPSAGTEYQMTGAIQALLAEEQVLAYEYEGMDYGCSSKLGLLKANIELWLQHHEISDKLCSYFKNELLVNI